MRMTTMRMDAIPCRLVFLALFFGARIQHTEGRNSGESVRAFLCRESRSSGGPSEGCSLFASNCSPKESLSAKMAQVRARQREREKERDALIPSRMRRKAAKRWKVLYITPDCVWKRSGVSPFTCVCV
ncbi:hypothetical protein QQF64_022409 [Cirrhinus molitorella]|uniref:Secreted protein n=1 Tax=Cirrhinus molitorella TaxID=172907 RepID=A0ABR3LAG9_9TELE